jgi:hypothetical protein
MWTIGCDHHKDRTPTHGYAATRLEPMAAFAKSWPGGSASPPYSARGDTSTLCGINIAATFAHALAACLTVSISSGGHPARDFVA